MPSMTELAMREVDEIHHPPDQRETRGEKCVDGSQKETTYDHLQKKHRLIFPARHRPL